MVHTYSNFHGVQITNKAEQETGETYGCKSRDLSELRFECVCSDLPYFYLPKSFFMHTQKGHCDCQNNSTAALLDKIIGFNDWILNTPKVKQVLNELLLIYIQSDQVEGAPSEKREDIAFSIYLINSLLDDLREYELTLKMEAA